MRRTLRSELLRLEGHIGVLCLLTSGFAALLFGWIGTSAGYELEGQMFGCVAMFALSVGFAISAVRFGKGLSHGLGVALLVVDFVIVLSSAVSYPNW